MNLLSESKKMVCVRWYEKYYVCPECATEWADEWSCLCNDRCPNCNLESSPVSWKDKSRALVPEDYDGAERKLRSIYADSEQEVVHTATSEQARDYAEAQLEGR